MKRYNIAEQVNNKSEMKHLQRNLKQLQKQMQTLLKVKKPKQSDIKRLCLPSVSLPKIDQKTQNMSILRAEMKSLEHLDKITTAKIKQLRSDEQAIINEERLNNENVFSKFTKYSNQVKLRNSIKRIRKQLIKNRKQTLMSSNWKQNTTSNEPVQIKIRSKSSNQNYNSVEQIKLDTSKKVGYQAQVNKIVEIINKNANKQPSSFTTFKDQNETKNIRIRSQTKNIERFYTQCQSNVLSGIQNGLMKSASGKLRIKTNIISEEQKINKGDRSFQSITNSPRNNFLRLSRFVLIFSRSAQKDKMQKQMKKSDLESKPKGAYQAYLKKPIKQKVSNPSVLKSPNKLQLDLKSKQRQQFHALEMPCSPWDLLEDSFQDPFS